ncbi:MAG: hypothetical protein OR996_01545 [Phycisphaerales bacterium]|nr:hypothetical protein [Phycisphaerales bacterium]
MSKLHFIASILTLTLCSAVFSQPRSISSIVGESDISQEDEVKIQKFAVAWAQELETEDGEALERAHKKLASPFDADARMTPNGRNLYGKYLKEGFSPLLSVDNQNEMAAVNALQIYSLLGTEQGCSVLIKHAHASSEDRDALRLWASIGIGTTFLVGELKQNRVDRYATLLGSYIPNESVWYIIARQFDSLASLQEIPGLEQGKRREMEDLSFSLQTDALVALLASIPSSGADERVQALSLVLPSLRLQLNEPGIDAQLKDDVYRAIIPPLTTFVENAATFPPSDDADSLASYGRAVQAASLLVSKGTGVGDADADVATLWSKGDYDEIITLVRSWRSSR